MTELSSELPCVLCLGSIRKVRLNGKPYEDYIRETGVVSVRSIGVEHERDCVNSVEYLTSTRTQYGLFGFAHYATGRCPDRFTHPRTAHFLSAFVLHEGAAISRSGK
jgi:hypothetical protein